MIMGNAHSRNHGIIEGNCTLDNNYRIVMADQRFYQMIGYNSIYPLNRLMDEANRKSFEAFYCDETKLNIIVKCRLKDDMFRWVQFWKRKKTRVSNQIEMLELRVQDIVNVSTSFESAFQKVQKYRAVINMVQEKIFEYDLKTEILTIYCYVNNYSEIIERDNLMSWKDRMLQMEFVDSTQSEQFIKLCDSIRTGVESFSVTIHSSIMSKGERMDILNFKGQTIMDGSERYLVIGVISEMGSRGIDKAVLYDASAIEKDSATQLLNKQAVTNTIQQSIEQARMIGDLSPMYMMILDIDNFKNVNDTYGHYFGDEVIFQFANELAHVVGSRGILGRIGGDEFIVLFNDVNCTEEITYMLNSVRKKLKLELAQEHQGYQFSISAGISQYPKDADCYENLFKIADASLYLAKEKGKDRYIIYSSEKHGDLLHKEIQKNAFVVGIDFMKPIDKVELASQLIIRLMREGSNAIGDVLGEFMDKMNIHGITIFAGKDMQCVYCDGHYAKHPDSAFYIFDPEYDKLFNLYKMNIIDNVLVLSVDFPNAYQTMKHNSICSAIQILIGKKEKTSAMIEIDNFGSNRRKWSQDDILTIYLVVKALENVFENEINI